MLYMLTFGFVQNNLHIGFENPYVYSKSSTFKIEDSRFLYVDVGVREMFQELVPITQKNVAFGS